MTLKLYPFQTEGVNFLISGYHRLLADDMGLGKTIQVIAAINKLGAKSVVVICPATVKIHWARKIAEFSERKHAVCIIQNGKTKIPPSATIIIVNYELLLRESIHRQLDARGSHTPYDVAVIDEAHYLKNIDAKRTKRILGATSFLRHAKYKWPLTGTPVLNRPVELFPLLSTLAPEAIAPYSSWSAYTERYCAAHPERICSNCFASVGNSSASCVRCGCRNTIRGGIDVRGHSNVDELSEKLKSFMLRRKKEDVLDQLPDTVESVIELNCQPSVDLADAPISTARRELALAKIPMAQKYISDLLEDIDKVVVFAHHRTVIEELASALQMFGAVIVYGGMSADEKQSSIDDFINNPATKVLIAQTAAGGTGVDGLQGVCNYVVFIELDWSPGIMAQAIDRLRRIGQKNTVFVHYLAVADSLDTKMAEVLDKKRNVINRLIKAKEQITMDNSEIKKAIAEAIAAMAKAMDALARLAESEVEAIAAQPAPEPIVEKPKAPKKAAKPAPEPEPTPIIEQIEAEVEAEIIEEEKDNAAPQPVTMHEITEEDMRHALARFIAATPDQAKNRQIINTLIWPKFDATAFANLNPDFYPAAMEELKKGPEAFSLGV